MPDAQQRVSALTDIRKLPAEAHFSEAQSSAIGIAAHTPMCVDSPVGAETAEQQIARLTDRCLELESQLRRVHKLETLGLVAGGIAHDFNNLLTGILGYAEVLRSELAGSPRLLECIDVIEAAATQAAQLTSRLLVISRGGHGERITVDLHQALRQVLDLLQRSADKGIQVTHEFHPAKLELEADPTEIFQIFLNLGLNARDAVARGGQISFRTEVVEQATPSNDDDSLNPGTYALISVIDDGEGIDESIRERIFEPFFTTKTSAQGTGMGLAVVRRIVSAYDGAVALESEPGQGARFFVYLPLAAAAQAAKKS